MATIWTTADRDAIKQALLDLAQGKRVVRLTFNSDAGQRTYEYGQADMPQLEALLGRVNQALSHKRVGFRTSSGFS